MMKKGLAEAKGMMIGVEKIDDTVILTTASASAQRTKEISDLLK